MSSREYQDGREVKALDLRSTVRMHAWVRTPLLVVFFLKKKKKKFHHVLSLHACGPAILTCSKDRTGFKRTAT